MCTSLWAEVERDKMSVSCVRWKGKHGDFSSGRLFMPLVYALQTTNANQMLVTLLKWLWRIGIQTNRPSAKLKDFMFHFQIFIPLFFFFFWAEQILQGKRLAHTDGYPLHVRRGGGGGAAQSCDASCPTVRQGCCGGAGSFVCVCVCLFLRWIRFFLCCSYALRRDD